MSGKIYFITTILSIFLLISFTAEITASGQTSVASINNVEGLPGSDVDVLVSIDNGSGAFGINITIGYNSSAVVFKSASAGGLIPSGWIFTPYDNGSGSLQVAMLGATAISGGGVLLDVKFTIKSNAAASTYPVTLDSCVINEVNQTTVNGSIKVLPIASTTTTTTSTTTTSTTLTSTTLTSTTLSTSSTSSTSTTTTSSTTSTSATSTTTTSTTLTSTTLSTSSTSSTSTTTITTTSTTTTICGENPNISSLTPTKGTYGRNVTIEGSDFCDEKGTVVFINGTKKVNSSDSDIINWNDTQIVVSVPWGCKPGPNKVKIVTALNNESNTKPFNFVKPIPKIIGTSSKSGQIGAEIVITGINYGKQDKKSRVLFGNIKADISEWNNNSMTVTVPEIFVGNNGKIVSVKVITRYGTSNSKKFKVLKLQ